MNYSKNKFLLFRYILGLLLLLTTIPSYANQTTTSDTKNQEINQTETTSSNTENIKTQVSYKETTVKQYNKLCQNAEEIINKGNYEKAIESLNKAIKLCPDKENAYALKSICLRLLTKIEEAKENAQLAYKLNPNSYLANEEMGTICCLESNYKKAIFFLDKAEQLNKNYERTYNNRGLTYYLSNEYDKSIADFNKALEINPNSLFAHQYRAYSYLNADSKKNAQLALKDANFLIQQEPKNMNWFKLRALCYAYLNNVPMALADINKTVKNDPDNFQSYIGRLEIYELINASQNLISKDINSAEQCAGNDPDKLLTLAHKALDKDENNVAERFIDKVLKIEPANNEAISIKAFLQVSNHDYNNALISLKKVKEPSSDEDYSYMFYITRALAKFGIAGLDNKQLITEGLSDLNYLIEKNNTNQYAYNLRGAAHIALGEYQQGINDIKKAEELGTISINSIYWLGLANFKLGKIKLEDNIYMKIISSYNAKPYNEKETSLEEYLQEGFDNTPDSDVTAKINFLTFTNSDINFINSKSLLEVISEVEDPNVKIGQTYEQNGKIIALPYKNINSDYGNNISQQTKNKIITMLAHRALIAAIQEFEDIDTPLNIFLETATTKQKIDGLLTIIDKDNSLTLIDCIPATNTSSLNKIIDNINLYDSSIKSDQDKIKQILRKTYIKLAIAEEEENGLESAIYYYNRAIEYGYPKFDVYENYAYYYFNNEDYFNAVQWATKALNTKNDAKMYGLRGEAKSKLKDYDGAIYDYTKALGFDSKLYEAYFLRAGIYFDQKKWSMAQNDYIKYATYNKKDAAAPFNIATCLQNQGKKQAALPWYEKAKALYQESGDEESYNECVRRINRIKGYNTWW